MLFLDVKWCKQEYIYWSDIQQNSPEFSKYCAFIAYVKGRVCLFIVTCFFLFYSRSCQKSILIEKNSLSCFRCLFFTVCYIQCIIYYNESSDIFPILFQVREFGVIYVMLCAIWYHLHNLKNVKMTHVVVLLLVVFFNCRNGTKSRNTSHMEFIRGRSKSTSPGEGGRGFPKMVTNGDIGGRRVCSNGDVTTVFVQH